MFSEVYSYTFFQWLAFFFVYCFVGWCIESAIVSLDQKKPVNRGFLRGPVLPLYGFGAMTILFVCLPVRDNPVLVYLCGMLGTTILEYFTGWAMETILKTRYWDYSNAKFNIKGRICLMSSLFWGFLSMVLMYVLHSFTEKVILAMPDIYVIIFDCIICVLFAADTVYAFRTAIDVNTVLNKITEIRTELTALRGELREHLEESERYIEISERIERLRQEREEVKRKIGMFKSDFIRAHPTAVSSRFNDALKELREHLK